MSPWPPKRTLPEFDRPVVCVVVKLNCAGSLGPHVGQGHGPSAAYTAKGAAGWAQPGSSPHSPAHALQGLCEDLWGHAMFMLQDQALLQGHRHGCAVLGTLAAGESDPIEAATDLPIGSTQESRQKSSTLKGREPPQM